VVGGGGVAEDTLAGVGVQIVGVGVTIVQFGALGNAALCTLRAAATPTHGFAVAVKVGVADGVSVGVDVGVGVVCATFAALRERVERIRIAKAMSLLAI